MDDPQPDFLGIPQSTEACEAVAVLDVSAGDGGLAVSYDESFHLDREVDGPVVTATMHLSTAQRVRHHVRRPLAGSRNLLMKTAGNTLSETVPIALAYDEWRPPGGPLPARDFMPEPRVGVSRLPALGKLGRTVQ